MLPEQIINCLETLKNNGITAYLVGGCVRDMLLGTTPHDYDITSNAPPDKICALFDKVIKTGLKHGTVTVIMNGEPVEITRMRTESGYSDFRRPDKVMPTDDIKTDLCRRDFTVNAMAMDIDGKIIDPFSGRDDLKKRVIKAVGDPKERFSEDALRIMRAFRFAAQLGFEIEENTQNAAVKLCGELKFISAERIFAELCKTLLSDSPQKLLPLIECGGLSPFGIDRCSGIFKTAKLSRDIKPRLALFLSLCGADASQSCRKLKTSTECRRFCEYFERNKLSGTDNCSLRKIICDLGERDGELMYEAICVYNEKEPKKGIILKLSKGACSVDDLPINGNDLKKIGFSGREISFVLDSLIEEVRRFPNRNTKEYLIKRAESFKTERNIK